MRAWLSRRRLALAAAIVLAAGAVAAGLLLAAPEAEVGASGPTPAAERRPAPELEGNWLVPPPVRLADLRGKPVVINFWASWCERKAKVVEASVTLNYTTVLNIIFLALAAALIWRYFRRGGGLAMLRMMDKPMVHEHAHEHAGGQLDPEAMAADGRCRLAAPMIAVAGCGAAPGDEQAKQEQEEGASAAAPHDSNTSARMRSVRPTRSERS